MIRTIEYRYDDYDNIVYQYTSGDGASKEIEHFSIYSSEISACANAYIMDKHISEIQKSNNKELRKVTHTIDCANGNVMEVRQHINSTASAVTTFEYHLIISFTPYVIV